MGLIYIIGILTCFLLLSYVKKVEFIVFKSEIQPKNWLLDDLSSMILLSIMWPYTFYKLYFIKTKQITFKMIKKLLITVISLILIWNLGTAIVSIYNTDKTLRNSFIQKKSERTSFYNKMYNEITQHSEIVIANDSSFRHIVNLQVTGQKNGDKLMWAWVQQSNPTATFSEVSAMYTQLGNLISNERQGFFEQERQLQSIKNQHDNLVDLFPGFLVMRVLGREKIDYQPIISDVTQETINSNRDNNIKLWK